MTTTLEREIRVCPADLADLRAEEDEGRMFLAGLAAPFNSLSQDLGGFRERIRPGAFTRALETGQDVVCVPDHDYRAVQVLGRTTAGTLKLSQDDLGLRFRCQLPDTAAGRDVFAVAKRRDLRGMSFAFIAAREGSERWLDENGVVIRELDDLDLYDVAPVLYPAYPATTCTVSRRALDQAAHLGRPKCAPCRVRHLRRRLEIQAASDT